MPYDAEIHIRHGAYLPHWTKEGAIYHVRFRLADSVPQTQLRAWEEERKEIVEHAARAGRRLTPSEQRRLDFLFSEKVEQYLDAGYGACFLRRDDVARTVANALQLSESQHYHLFAWCIMPNHVHVVVQPFVEHTLQSIAKVWKGSTARYANILLGRRGTFWQQEYFDHLLRNEESLERTVGYVWQNPEKAGFTQWKWRWKIA